MELLTGNVKWYNSRQGYGFILNDKGEDVFVHFSMLNTMKFKTIAEGQTVTYVMGQDEGGRPMACNVTVITKLNDYFSRAFDADGNVVDDQLTAVANEIAEINPLNDSYKFSAQEWLTKTIPYVNTDAFEQGLHNFISVYKVGQSLITPENDEERDNWIASISDPGYKDFVQKFIQTYPDYTDIITCLNENLYKIYKGRL